MSLVQNPPILPVAELAQIMSMLRRFEELQYTVMTFNICRISELGPFSGCVDPQPLVYSNIFDMIINV